MSIHHTGQVNDDVENSPPEKMEIFLQSPKHTFGFYHLQQLLCFSYWSRFFRNWTGQNEKESFLILFNRPGVTFRSSPPDTHRMTLISPNNVLESSVCLLSHLPRIYSLLLCPYRWSVAGKEAPEKLERSCVSSSPTRSV